MLVMQRGNLVIWWSLHPIIFPNVPHLVSKISCEIMLYCMWSSRDQIRFWTESWISKIFQPIVYWTLHKLVGFHVCPFSSLPLIIVRWFSFINLLVYREANSMIAHTRHLSFQWILHPRVKFHFLMRKLLRIFMHVMQLIKIYPKPHAMEAKAINNI